MKFRITFKTPDVVEDSISEFSYGSLSEEFGPNHPDFDEQREIMEDELHNIISKWVKYGEMITIEFDTVAKTATVVEA